MQTNLHLDKPHSKKDFAHAAKLIRRSIGVFRDERITFNMSGFKVTCDNTPDAINNMACKLEKRKGVYPARVNQPRRLWS